MTIVFQNYLLSCIDQIIFTRAITVTYCLTLFCSLCTLLKIYQLNHRELPAVKSPGNPEENQFRVSLIQKQKKIIECKETNKVSQVKNKKIKHVSILKNNSNTYFGVKRRTAKQLRLKRNSVYTSFMITPLKIKRN